MKVLILGGQGMLGHKLYQRLHDRFETIATFRTAEGLWQQIPFYQASTRTLGGVNALLFDSVVEAVAQVKPDVVINGIGIIKQLRAAKDPIVSLEINALFPHRLARLCRAADARLITVSTDCVFGGTKGNYAEDDLPDAQDLYGRTKLLGELHQSHCLTLRTSIIGRDFLKNTGLLEWFLSNRGQTVKGFTHAIFSGLTTLALADLIASLIAEHPALSGLYHVAADPIDKYTLLTRIRDQAQLDIEIVPDDTLRINRSLSAARFLQETQLTIPTWEQMIDDLLADPTPYDAWRQEHGIA